jgi:DNA-3-methyladenine glycosylase II
MKLTLPTSKPFSFAQTLVFAGRFAPLEATAIVTSDALTIALADGGRGWPIELRDARGDLEITLPDGAPRRLARRAADVVGASDDLAPFYAAAEHDAAMRPVVRELHGLHQVRFLGLEEIAVYAVMMQRTPMAMATRMKQRFLARFGYAVDARGETLRAMPELAELAALDATAIAEAIGHRGKADRIATVVRAVHRLGEPFLRTAPYAEARDALLAIPGIGPFSAGAILLRGLGRTDEIPSLGAGRTALTMFEPEGRVLYGAAWVEADIVQRYGAHIGTWAFYLKTAVARISDSGTPSGSGMRSRSRGAAARTGPRRSRGTRRGRTTSRTSSPAS